jgi:hypothetical protein
VFPVGGVEVMLLGAVLAAAGCAVLALVLQRGVGWFTASTIAGFVWTVVVIGLITLIPASGAPGIVPAEGRLETCSWDIGGPAPEGFWIFAGTQRLLNTVVFVPSGALLVLAAARWRSAWLTIPLGLAGLAAYSAAIEWTQLALARIDRACDVTDIIDNVTGAVVGVVIGIVLTPVLRPWRRN